MCRIFNSRSPLATSCVDLLWNLKNHHDKYTCTQASFLNGIISSVVLLLFFFDATNFGLPVLKISPPPPPPPPSYSDRRWFGYSLGLGGTGAHGRKWESSGSFMFMGGGGGGLLPYPHTYGFEAQCAGYFQWELQKGGIQLQYFC